MNAIKLIVATVLVAFTTREAAGERVACQPGHCSFPDHMEMLAWSYEDVDPRVDAVVVGRVEAARLDAYLLDDRHENGGGGTDKVDTFWMDVLVDESVAGCFLPGDRFSTSVFGYGGLHWRERSPSKYWREKPAEEMALVLALAEANWNLEREVHERVEKDDFSLYHELPARYERNRRRLFELGVAHDLPFLLLSVFVGGIDDFGRQTEVVVVPAQRYLMFVPGRRLRPWEQTKFSSVLRFDIYPASFAQHLPRGAPPEECEQAQRPSREVPSR